MERVNFFNGQRISAEDLNSISETLSKDMCARTVDFYNKGVIGSMNSVYVLKGLNNTIKVLPFIAYTNSGERVYVYKEISGLALDLTNTKEKRLCQQGTLSSEDFGWDLGVSYDIYVAYVEKGGRPRPQYGSGVFYPTRVYTGFEFYALKATDTSTTDQDIRNNCIRLCNVTCNVLESGEKTLDIKTTGYLQFTSVKAEKIYSDTQSTQTIVYSPLDTSVSMQEHIMAIGSGTPSATNPHGITAKDLGLDSNNIILHEQMLHSASIVGDIDRQEAGFGIGLNYITDKVDNLKLFNLKDGEYFQANGRWFDCLSDLSAQKEPYVFLNFVHDGIVLSPGTYLICVDKSNCKLHIGFLSDTTSNVSTLDTSIEATSYVYLSRDAEGSDTVDLTPVAVESITSLSGNDYFPLATFTFTGSTKQKSTISPVVPESNFTTKKDQRVFGSINANDLAVTKESGETELYLPYTLHAKSLIVGEGDEKVIFTNKSGLPTNYIQGFEVRYNSQYEIVIEKGCARDQSDLFDIRLNGSLIKSVRDKWTLGGSSVGVGGLQNNYVNPSLEGFPLGTTLHVFVISDGTVTDAAIDTDINGANILNIKSPTSAYKFIRRIASITTALTTGVNGQFRLPQFNSIASGNELRIYYSEDYKQQLAQSNSTTGTATSNCLLPKGINVVGYFRQTHTTQKVDGATVTTENVDCNVCFTSDVDVLGSYLKNTYDFEVATKNGTIKYVADTGYTGGLGTIICKGYKDGRGL